MARPRKRHVQQELFRPHGGKRKNAGRKQTNERKSEPHRARPHIRKSHALHISLRPVSALGRLRRRKAYSAIRRAANVVLARSDFRVIHISIQANHIHLIVEANDKRALAAGMKAFQVSAARKLNAALGRTGTVFPDHYHLEIIDSPRQTRNALAYVLKNASHCTLSGRRVEFPTCWAQTRLLQRAQRAVGYRRARFEDFIWDRPSLPWPGQIDFEVRYSPGVPQQLNS